MRYIFLIILSVSLFAESSRASFFNHEITNREIVMNQTVGVRFTTMQPRAGVTLSSIESTVRIALESGDSRNNWRLIGKFDVSFHKKINTVTVSFALCPRKSGTIPLPIIPVKWINGNKSAEFGNVTVREKLISGNAEQKLPEEVDKVVGYSWYTPVSVLQTAIGEKKAQKFPETNTIIFSPNDKVSIVCKSRRMSSVRIVVDGVSLSQARHRFISRWGDPMIDGTNHIPSSMTWFVGWLKITAVDGQQDGAGTPFVTVELVREDIENSIVSEQLDNDLFDVISGKKKNLK